MTDPVELVGRLEEDATGAMVCGETCITTASLLTEAAACIREMVEWRDIETAPRDGTPILITRDARFMVEDGWHVVRWEDDWWTCHDGKFDTPLRGPNPTHWLPLPPAPGTEA